MHDYTNTTAVVTGASKGLGEAYARELASRGAHLILVARSADALNTLAGQIRKAHSVRVDVIAADLSDRRSPQTVVNAIEKLGLDVDLLVNNAGMGSVGPFLGRPLEPNFQSVDVNVTALIGLVHLLGAGMVERGRGGIVNVASTAAFQPMPYQASYAATKAFVLSFTEALAEEVRGTGVRVMAAHPGATATGFFDRTTASMDPKTTDTPPASLPEHLTTSHAAGPSPSPDVPPTAPEPGRRACFPGPRSPASPATSTARPDSTT
ncbi:SDR family NAD(P)-dependent oxidoreductase [Streptomyces sp. M10(2022)]